MKKSIAMKWVKALRSGKYEQGKAGQLKDEDGGYCCLGVLCEITNTMPDDYFREHTGEMLNVNAMRISGMRNSVGSFDGKYALSKLNDGEATATLISSDMDERFTFEEIADIIEQVYEDL